MALQIRRELADLIRREVKDPRVQQASLVTVTHVHVAEDFSTARVLVSVVGSDGQATVRALVKAAGFLRGSLGRRVHVRRIPELHFYLDDTEEKAGHIDALLHEIELEEAGRRAAAQPPEVATALPGTDAERGSADSEDEESGGGEVER